MTRILHIIPTLDRGGAEKQLTLLAAGLQRAGHEVQVCCLTRGGPLECELEAAKVPVTIIGKRWKLDPFAYSRLKRHIVLFQPEIVHTWLFAANWYGRHAALQSGVPHILANERCVDRWKNWVHFGFDHYYARGTEKITTNSSGVVEFYANHGIAREKFVVIPNGIVPTDIPAQATDRTALLQDLGLPPQARLIAAVNRLWPQKAGKRFNLGVRSAPLRGG